MLSNVEKMKTQLSSEDATRLQESQEKLSCIIRDLIEIKHSLKCVNELAAMAEVGRSERGIIDQINKTRLKQEFIAKSERREGICYAFPCQSPICFDIEVCKRKGGSNEK